MVTPYFDNVKNLTEIELVDDHHETGNSFREIAEGKAIYFSKQFGGLAIATDGGMIIPALENWNPLYTRRFISNLDKSDKNDFQRMDELLELTKDLVGDQRLISWKEAVAIADNGRLLYSDEVFGSQGILQTEYDKTKYRRGIWTCSLWAQPEYDNKNFFDLTEEEVKAVEVSWAKIADGVDDFLRNSTHNQ